MNFKSIFSVALAFFAMATQVQAEEKVVATVNGVPVLESQIKPILNKRTSRQAAIDKVINDMLVNQAVKESGVKVNEAKIDQIIEGIAAQNGLTFGQLLDALDYQGINYHAYRQQIAQQVLMAEVRNHAISQSVDVTREQVEELAEKMQKEAKAKGKMENVKGTEYEVRHILLKLNPLLNDAQAKKQLTQIRADIVSGKMTFAEAALKYSKDYLSGANGGNLGYAFPEAYVGPFSQAIRTAKKGEISAPFKSEFGWHILEVTNTRQGDRTEEAYRQKAYEQIVNQQLQDSARDWVQALRKRADIKYLN